MHGGDVIAPASNLEIKVPDVARLDVKRHLCFGTCTGQGQEKKGCSLACSLFFWHSSICDVLQSAYMQLQASLSLSPRLDGAVGSGAKMKSPVGSGSPRFCGNCSTPKPSQANHTEPSTCMCGPATDPQGHVGSVPLETKNASCTRCVDHGLQDPKTLSHLTPAGMHAPNTHTFILGEVITTTGPELASCACLAAGKNRVVVAVGCWPSGPLVW